jgi:hypothetical protein
MINQQHPITPPPELVQQWLQKWHSDESIEEVDSDIYIANRAAQWGADQELKACCEWLRTESKTALWQTEALRVARRPKPLSLKQRALEAMHRNWNPHNNDDFATIARALEALSDD